MRNMSFALTTAQARAKTKTVTRRLRWDNLKPGDRIQQVVKGMGLKKGEKVEKIHVIEIVSVRKESLNSLTRHLETGVLTLATKGGYFTEEAEQECVKEGFPHLTPRQFVAMFCAHNGCEPETPVNRIEFKYV